MLIVNIIFKINYECTLSSYMNNLVSFNTHTFGIFLIILVENLKLIESPPSASIVVWNRFFINGPPFL